METRPFDLTDLTELIASPEAAVRDRALDDYAKLLTTEQILAQCDLLEAFRHSRDSLYERVRALFFLASLYRFHLPAKPGFPLHGQIPYEGYTHLLERRFEEAVSRFLKAQREHGPSDTLASALAASYHRLAFQTLADQVRKSVRSVRGNQWMFRMGHPLDQPLRVRPELLHRKDENAPFPLLMESTPVRMDLTHSAWSDIFFLGMDYPEGAKVLNVSIDLALRGRDASPKPPVEAYFRVIDASVVRLSSVDLGASAEITDLAEIFDFARDHLGLLKAALIASGLVPPGIEGSGASLGELLTQLVGGGRGIELVSNVNGIPKGSRLAVSTSLLAGLIAACMRATSQTASLTGSLEEPERRLVASRAILGEWIAGSGGGWQDSGGVWPGIKLIFGQEAQEGDPEFGVSRGKLLPGHSILPETPPFAEANPDAASLSVPPASAALFASSATRKALQDSLVLVHGGMAQNVGPILEMVTEKYLLRSPAEWKARGETGRVLDAILEHLKTGDIEALGHETTLNFFQPLQTIIPWCSNLYTEELIRLVREAFGDDFWGFWMLGGMAGGGMGFIFAPKRKAEAQDFLQKTMSLTRKRLDNALPFAMEPVVYEFAINERGTTADLKRGDDALLPSGYYTMTAPHLLREDPRTLTGARRGELAAFARACRVRPELSGMASTLFDHLMPSSTSGERKEDTLSALLEENGFDRVQHEKVRTDLKSGRIGLAQNRLPVTSEIEDVRPGDVFDFRDITPEMQERGRQALANGEVAVVSLAAGVGSRWTQGAGVVKALHPFAKLGGRHRTFIETHLAKSRRVGRETGSLLPHVFTTSHLTHAPIEAFLASENQYGYAGTLALSPGKAIGLRMIPTVRDLRFHFEETPQQTLDERKQKMQESVHAALLGWAAGEGEGGDYTDNLPSQCLHPVGHWFEIPNLIKNGTLASLLQKQPNLRTLMLHNIDTLGADVDAGLLGLHRSTGSVLNFEVMPRRLEDRGGGLARVDGRLRLVEGLAMPREEAEFALTYYNSLTTWIEIDGLLALFGLTRDTLDDDAKSTAGIRALALRIPTYVTLKEVKKRWGQGQEDVYPVAQFEKLWGDMTALSEVSCSFVAVPRLRAQQLKDQAQLDGWLRDGSATYVEALSDWG